MSEAEAALIGGPESAQVRRALLSVSDKTGLVAFAKVLADCGVELVSTGGTAAALKDSGLRVIEVGEVTGFPEIMGGRVKTLHPKVHGGLLARRDEPGDRAAMAEHGIAPIDLVAVNLYPFEATLRGGADAATLVENIDIGGPAMIRAAAKNAAHVTVITEPADYDSVAEALKREGGVPRDLRARLAAKAFARTAAYDAAIAGWLAGAKALPDTFLAAARMKERLRYGENPHQQAGLYVADPSVPAIATARQLQGKALSYNNINDADAALELVAEFDPAEGDAVAIVKHANPCGVAVGASLREAYDKALACDPVSAFGGIVAVNRPLDAEAAEAISGIFTEVVVAPDADGGAIKTFGAKPNLRLLLTGGLPDPAAAGLTVRSVGGGFLVQWRDGGRVERQHLRIVTKREPSEQEMADLLFAFRVVKHVKSNAIVYAKDRVTVGIGAGQMSRIDSARIAAIKASESARAAGLDAPLTQGSVVASDAFFPFADGLLAAAEAGATAVIQPGGSVRDEEVIAAADEAGLAMVFTGVRHFRH